MLLWTTEGLLWGLAKCSQFAKVSKEFHFLPKAVLPQSSSGRAFTEKASGDWEYWGLKGHAVPWAPCCSYSKDESSIRKHLLLRGGCRGRSCLHTVWLCLLCLWYLIFFILAVDCYLIMSLDVVRVFPFFCFYFVSLLHGFLFFSSTYNTCLHLHFFFFA